MMSNALVARIRLILVVSSLAIGTALAFWGRACGAGEASPVPLTAALLTTELGDPRQPGNVKLAVALPEGVVRRDAAVSPSDFRIYVHPDDLTRREGMSDRYRAGGLYLWRVHDKIFIDARIVPQQEREGPARVQVVYAPGGAPLAEGEAEGSSRYAADLVDVVLAVDVSLSMNYNDPRKRRVAAAKSFIEMARKGGGIGRVGLITFNHFASRRTPLLPLERGEELLAALDGVGAEGLTSLDAPLELAMRDLRDSRRPVVILLTDGKNEGSEYMDTHLRAAEAGVRIFTIGLSRQADHGLLKEMAAAAGGGYYRADRDAELPEIYARLAAELGKRRLLRASVLDAGEGETTLPIDRTVKRIVAIADGGARVALDGPGGALLTAGAMSGTHIGIPEAGRWRVAWENAVPGVSALALFGDTQLFLDVFPPQLHGEDLAVGATLGQGGKPLPGAEIWLEAPDGVLPGPIRLFDDGMHGDGAADDGVYGALATLERPSARFGVTVRASGHARDDGEFVRQASALAIRVDEPPAFGTASLDGEVDFGVLFPGETGSALARIDLDSDKPRELDLDLAWDEGGEDWPDLFSTVAARPGKQVFELEMTVPARAAPGEYRGAFSVFDGERALDRTAARVRVGTVRFGSPDSVDLGSVPPGTFANQTIRVPFAADKDAPLEVRVDARDGLSAKADVAILPAGRGEFAIDVVAPAPIGTKEGEYSGKIILGAGPGHAEIPLRWRVKPLVASPVEVTPPPGLPDSAELPADTSPLRLAVRPDPDLWRLGVDGAGGPTASDSPWDRISESLRDRDGPGAAATPGDETKTFAFPETEAPAKPVRDSFWSAWWIYLLAALLLLLLLLLLLAYILYRLGKSQLARMLLASALANIILLIVFIILLGTSAAIAPRPAPSMAINLVPDEITDRAALTEAEESMLAATSSAGSASAEARAGESPAAGEVSLAAPAASEGESRLEKSAELPDGVEENVELAEASRQDAMSLDLNERRPLRRRDRLPGRSEGGEPAARSDLPEMPEMTEPPEPQSAVRKDTASETEETRLDIAAAEAGNPAWSDGEKPIQPLARVDGESLSERGGVEVVRLDPVARSSRPRGGRRSDRTRESAYPEPRVDIADPERDLEESVASNQPETRVEPGIEEVRVALLAEGPDASGEKPGTLLLAGTPLPSDAAAHPPVMGLPGFESPESAAPRGGPRSSRGGPSRRGTALPERDRDMPGGSAAVADSASSGSSGSSGQGRGGAGGGVDELRFRADAGDAAGGDAEAQPAGGPRGQAALSGGGASPNPFKSGGGQRQKYEPGRGTSGRSGGDSRDTARRGPRSGGGGTPRGLDGVPGGGTPAPGSGSGTSPEGGRGRRGVDDGLGEGRVDDMARGGGGGGFANRTGDGARGLEGSGLSGDAGPGELGTVPFASTDTDWKRNGRRTRRRVMNVAASSVDMDSLVIVVGDFGRLPDSASENLFQALARRLGRGLAVEERLLSPGDGNLADCLLALAAPREVESWNDADLRAVAKYLAAGGHIWIDAERRSQIEDAMRRLAGLAAGDFVPLGAGHQLAEGEAVDAIAIGGKPAVVATYRNWRKDWRHGDAHNGDTLRFLVRSLNYFLSGNADAGIVLAPEEGDGSVIVEPSREAIPELLAGGTVGKGRIWDDFDDGDAARWRIPSWSDRASLSLVGDGEGGRAMRMDMGGAVKGRTAVYRDLAPPQDLSGFSRVTVDAYYDGEGDASLSMILSVGGGEGWREYETPLASLTPGWNRLQFELDRNNFRSLSDGGGIVHRIPDIGRTARAGFFLYRKGLSPAVALFRDIRLHEE